ncbi:MAG: DUF3786 domain-containing protein [Clostridiales Family XIII bacterium]|jgi:hypothetical protein|nr:DUF3786 domain-containing protein [Clostridiales Family XIII bacterium]
MDKSIHQNKKAAAVTLPDASQRSSAAPMKHYQAIYRTQDPAEIASRTGLAFDAESSSFSVTLLGAPYRAVYPEFDLVPDPAAHTGSTQDGAPAAHTPVPAANGYEKLLIIRYLTEGSYALPSGKLVSYEELPWGSVYMSNFRGRVIGRLAREFGSGEVAFPALVESMPGLKYERLPMGDSGYRIEFLNNIFVSLIYYEGDEEFPASFQVLFNDTIKYAFTAEDVAVVGDVLIGRLKAHLGALKNGE